jgi:L-alanine-DL-glutamate epimerase-like enolase superfamily enzyme
VKISAVETVQVAEFSNLVWLRIETEDGLCGLGETFRNTEAVVAYLHETVAPYLLGKDALRIERHAHALEREVGNHFFGYPSRSVELRGNSAADLALWDLKGQALDVPLYELLGGLFNERVRVYNTCASAEYNKQARAEINSRLIRPHEVSAGGDALDDLLAQHADPGALATSLRDEGITAMKVWPFDAYADQSGGHHIAPAELARGVGLLERIRGAVGRDMDIMLEMHSLWHLPAAMQIARAVEHLDLYWMEDPVDTANFDDLLRFRDGLASRLAASENLGGRRWCVEALSRGAVDVITSDLAWLGGLTEGRKLAALAQSFDRPIAPHDCAGPVGLCANLHLLLASPNALLLETVRAFTRGFYRELVTALPRIEDGFAYPLHGAGLGTALAPTLLARDDVTIRRSEA